MARQQTDEEARRKAGMFLLAAFCAFCLGQGIHLLLYGAGRMDVLRGGGEVLFWGCLAGAVLARLHRRGLPGIRLGIYTGAAMIVMSWLY